MTAGEAKEISYQNQITLEKILKNIKSCAERGEFRYYVYVEGESQYELLYFNGILDKLKNLGYTVFRSGSRVEIEW